MFTTMFDSNWLKTDINGSVQGGLWAELCRLHGYTTAVASGRASDKAIICQHSSDPHVYQMSLNSNDGAVI